MPMNSYSYTENPQESKLCLSPVQGPQNYSDQLSTVTVDSISKSTHGTSKARLYAGYVCTGRFARTETVPK